MSILKTFFIVIILSIFWNIVNFLSIIMPLLLAVALLTLVERKVLASFQRRRGPNIVGFIGFLQPIADGFKLLLKESIIPLRAQKEIFVYAPLFFFLASVLNWGVLVFPSYVTLVHIDLGSMYILCISSLSVYGIILAGWSSNSRYAFLGALRSAAQMISYEVSMGFIFLSILAIVGTLDITKVVYYQSEIWLIVPLFPMCFIFCVSALAETSRAPFDLPEAEGELVAGYNVEYSSAGFALFSIAEYLNIIMMSFFIVILFSGGWMVPFGIPIDENVGFMIKFMLVFFLFIWVRASFPRLRYDQLMRLGWKVFLPYCMGYFIILIVFLTLTGFSDIDGI